MRFLAVGSPTARYSPDAAKELVHAEMTVARQLYAELTIREGYLDDSFTQAVLLLDGADLSQVEAQLARYPMVQAGLIHFSVTALTGLPALSPAVPAARRDAWWPRDR
jgi:hypothetical protein